jgi:hypothetical protein
MAGPFILLLISTNIGQMTHLARRFGIVHIPESMLCWRPRARTILQRFLSAACRQQAHTAVSSSATRQTGCNSSEACTRAGQKSDMAAVAVPTCLELLEKELWGLLEHFLPPLLDWAAAPGRLAVPASPSSMAASVMRLLEQQLLELRCACPWQLV